MSALTPLTDGRCGRRVQDLRTVRAAGPADREQGLDPPVPRRPGFSVSLRHFSGPEASRGRCGIPVLGAELLPLNSWRRSQVVRQRSAKWLAWLRC